MDPRRFQAFFETHRRKYRGDSFRQHGFAGSWRTDHQHVVTAGHRHFDCALGVKLSSHIPEVFESPMGFRCRTYGWNAKRFHGSRSVDEVDDLGKSSHRKYRDAVYHGRFASISLGYEQVRDFQIPCQHRNRKDAAYWTELAV